MDTECSNLVHITVHDDFLIFFYFLTRIKHFVVHMQQLDVLLISQSVSLSVSQSINQSINLFAHKSSTKIKVKHKYYEQDVQGSIGALTVASKNVHEQLHTRRI